mmetsp:Transcript_57713/g.141570  ORF Transcript_57713/g.141570 Transcript_57713/m.141570 type:complete len:205 (+) Transcript_57713:651-1265(+)
MRPRPAQAEHHGAVPRAPRRPQVRALVAHCPRVPHGPRIGLQGGAQAHAERAGRDPAGVGDAAGGRLLDGRAAQDWAGAVRALRAEARRGAADARGGARARAYRDTCRVPLPLRPLVGGHRAQGVRVPPDAAAVRHGVVPGGAQEAQARAHDLRRVPLIWLRPCDRRHRHGPRSASLIYRRTRRAAGGAARYRDCEGAQEDRRV